MRLSVNSSDRGYRAFKALPKNVMADVTLDGMKIIGCVTADSRAGYVLAPERDSAGKVLVNAKRTHFKLVQLRGKVEIVIRPLA